jgi:heptosyltransferase-2
MTRTLDKDKIRNILVRATNWLGDAVMNTPALGAIRETFPTARITVLANPLVAQLLASHDGVDEVMVYDRQGTHAGLGGKLRLAGELRARRFDLAILLQDAFDAALIAALAGIPRRLGNNSDGRALLLTHGFAHREGAVDCHHVDNYLRMLAFFGINGSTKCLHLRTTVVEDAAMAKLLAGSGIGPDDFVLGVNPGATYGSAKRWYPERFAVVARELGVTWRAKVVITGGPTEAGMAGEIAAALDGACLNMAGKTDVRQLMALIKRCNFFISNDSGPMHIAAAFHVPLVAVFGSTDHRTTYPYADNAVVVRKETDCAPCLKRECPTDHRCMTAVTAEDVVAAAEKLKNQFKVRRPMSTVESSLPEPRTSHADLP